MRQRRSLIHAIHLIRLPHLVVGIFALGGPPGSAHVNPDDGENLVAAAKKSASAPDEGYCVKCKAKRKIADANEIKMANGRPALKGKCPVCGTGMFKILPPKK